jgi:hypothetical protein
VEGEPSPLPDDSIPILVGRLIDDGEEFVRAELKLYRARLLRRVDKARNGIILIVIALSLAQAVIVAALVGALILLRPEVGPGWATAIVVVCGLTLAGLLAWLAVQQLKRATAIDEPGERKSAS